MEKQYRVNIIAIDSVAVLGRVLNIFSRRRIAVDTVHTESRGENCRLLAISFRGTAYDANYTRAQLKKIVEVFDVRISERFASASALRPRTTLHPGKPQGVRIVTAQTANSDRLRLTLPPNANFYEELVKAMGKLGISSAALNIVGAHFRRLYYCVAPPDPLGKAVIAYTAPLDAGPSYLISANATLGQSVSGAPLIHCHAVFCTENATIRGGHIITDRSIVGSKPISLHVCTLPGIHIAQEHDAETNILLFQPQLRR